MDSHTEIILSHLQELSGCHLVWKTFRQARANSPLPCFGLHSNPYCLAVKEDPNRLRLCSHEDNVLMYREACRRQEPFPRTCHAGVAEYIVPIHEHGLLQELVYVGASRGADQSPYRDCQQAYEQLSSWNENQIRIAAELLAAALGQEGGDHSISLDPRLKQAVAIIESEFASKLTVPILAGRCHISGSHLARLFRQQLDDTVGGYLQETRLRRVRALLMQTDMDVESIALETGFTSGSHLSRCFLKCVGIRPGAFRKKQRDKT